ncbi:MAG: patatin-like phospholipase family protein [Lachnospiraceae bacterium]|nr:patatin-like phospholipase family protein [Lachnospiraceae bacterium]
MKPVLDLSKEYGIVLEGGGARGAYQIGAWKALKEAGVKIKGIAGTSVGALNGALMCMEDYENAEKVWKDISYSKVMDVDDALMSQLFQGKIPLGEAFEILFSTMRDGGVDVTPLRNLINQYVDAEQIQASPVEFYILTFCVDELKELDVDVHQIQPEELPDLLLASAYIFPLFKNEKLQGKTFIDGGVINNVPLGSLVNRGYEDIIMIRIYGPGREKKVKIPEGTSVYSVEPRIHLGNIIEFDAQKSRRNMTAGYYDTLRMIYGLKGSIYYVDAPEDERFYLNRLASLNSDSGLRKFVESRLSQVAHELKLSSGWNYQELYLAVLEAAARLLQIKKYKVYTLEALETAVALRKHRLTEGKKTPLFAELLYQGGIEEDIES